MDLKLTRKDELTIFSDEGRWGNAGGILCFVGEDGVCEAFLEEGFDSYY